VREPLQKSQPGVKGGVDIPSLTTLVFTATRRSRIAGSNNGTGTLLLQQCFFAQDFLRKFPLDPCKP
jgi:hypothetical protein